MAILRTEIFGRNLVGVYLEVTNSYVLYPPTISKSDLKKLKDLGYLEHKGWTKYKLLKHPW